MVDSRTVVQQFSARHWSRVPYEYEEFKLGDTVIALRHESGHTIFARESDPVSRYIMEIGSFRARTAATAQKTMHSRP